MIRNFIFKRRFLFLFLALLVPYVLHPLVATEIWGISLLDFSFTVILVMGVFAVSSRKHLAVTALSIVIIAQALTWTTHLVSSHVLILMGISISCLYLIYTAVILFLHILKDKSVTSETIFASLCIYLLAAFIWAFFYSFIEELDPRAFQINQALFADLPHGRHIFSKLYYFLYFSFTTLTSLGFGDILPANSWTRVFSSLEAVFGQLYLVVLVSRLVGLHISQAVASRPK